MSLDKSIEHGKEKRKPYRKAKSVSRQCRNHGCCSWCEGNRFIGDKRLNEQMGQEIKENEK